MGLQSQDPAADLHTGISGMGRAALPIACNPCVTGDGKETTNSQSRWESR